MPNNKAGYDPRRPKSIFEGDNLFQFAIGLNNAYRLKHGIGDADPFREDVGVCMVAIADAQKALERAGAEK